MRNEASLEVFFFLPQLCLSLSGCAKMGLQLFVIDTPAFHFAWANQMNPNWIELQSFRDIVERQRLCLLTAEPGSADKKIKCSHSRAVTNSRPMVDFFCFMISIDIWLSRLLLWNWTFCFWFNIQPKKMKSKKILQGYCYVTSTKVK